VSNITFSQANLPAVANLATALRALERDVPASGITLIKMDKTGHWVFGADQTDVEEDSTWAVNPFSFVHGFIAWGDGEVLGEKMVPVSQPLPELDPPPSGAKRGWETQVGFSMKCLTGEDQNLEVRYSATSVGGKRAVQQLALDIAEQVEKEQSKPVPVVRLRKDHYNHKSYGKIFTPVFEIVEFVSMDGKAQEVEAQDEPQDEAPRRRRRAV
jgi:hypothetical protein